jgi:type IV secretory pathway TraG/TraD family ATPase VirD4
MATAILAAGAVLLVGSGLLWLAGNLTGLLSGAGWPGTPLARAPHFSLVLLGGGDPGTAWPKTYPAAPALGPTWLFWTLALLLVCAITTVLLLLAPRLHTSRASRIKPARWATRRQQARIAVPDEATKRRWRLVAGRSETGRRLLAGEDCVSAVVLGPNGSGKTSCLVIPNTIDWDGPVLMTTAKPHDLGPVVAARSRRGPVWVIAPGGTSGHEAHGWSPVDYASDADRADRMAEWLVDSSGMTGDPKARPWNAQARKMLKGLLLAANLSHGGLGQWVEWIYAGERASDTVTETLRSHHHFHEAREYESTWRIHEEGKGSVMFTALGLADTYSRPGVVAAAERGGVDPAALIDARGTLCLVTPHGEGDRFAPYFTALVSAVIHEAETRSAAAGEALKPRLLLALDEAGNVFRYPRLPHLLTTARGNGIQLLLVYHDLAQLEHLYAGREVARTVLSNAKLRMLLPGVGDLDTLRYWSELMGRTVVHSHGDSWGADGHRSRSRSEHDDPLAPLHLLQQLPDGKAVLVYENLPPTRIQLRPWFTDRRLTQVAATHVDDQATR